MKIRNVVLGLLLVPTLAFSQKVYVVRGVQISESEYREMYNKFRREYVVDNGAIISIKQSRYARMECEVFQISEDNLILATFRDKIIAVKMLDATTLYDKQTIYIYGCKDGTYQYTNVRGATSTVEAYKQVDAVEVMPNAEHFYAAINCEDVFNRVRPPPPPPVSAPPKQILYPGCKLGPLRGPQPIP